MPVVDKNGGRSTDTEEGMNSTGEYSTAVEKKVAGRAG